MGSVTLGANAIRRVMALVGVERMVSCIGFSLSVDYETR
jgi:hypothetical protein